jgi:hypothetical protein
LQPIAAPPNAGFFDSALRFELSKNSNTPLLWSAAMVCLSILSKKNYNFDQGGVCNNIPVCNDKLKDK